MTLAHVRFLRLATVLLASLLVLGCATRNFVRDGADHRLMLRGNDPVAYFTMGRAVRGDPVIRAEHEGLIYRFVSEAHRAIFLREPARDVPAYGGACAGGANYALKTTIGADAFKIVDGRLFMFGGADALRHWEMDQAANIAVADRYWEDEMKDTPNRLQNWKRWIFRVPHYRTDAELEAEWQRRNGPK